MSDRILGIGLYGSNGHQIHGKLADESRAAFVAVSQLDRSDLTPSPVTDPNAIADYPTLAELLADDRVDLVSLCSPVRADQVPDVIACLRAGKAVLAEKPAAFSEADLDRILDVAAVTGSSFREMGGTAWAPHYAAMRTVVESGALGKIVQVFAQKSYPMHDRRPVDDETDGGLIRQVGVHAFRMIEHVSGLTIEDISVVRTTDDRGMTIAASAMVRLAGGVVGSVIINYLNQAGTGVWGNEDLRIFGTDGFVESLGGGQRTRKVLGDVDHGPLPLPATQSYLSSYLDALTGGATLPDLEAELHPTRIAIRAHDSAYS